MAKEVITMSKKEIDRLRILHRVMDRQLTQVYGAKLLYISDCQVRNLLYKIRKQGDKGIVNGNRGRRAPNKMPRELEEKIGSLIERKYTDFGPTLASEKLFELDGIKVSKEKARRIMITKGLWKARKGKRGDIHPWRERKAYFGEMIQFDGSHHMWLEERGPKMVFMGYIDDATNHTFGRFYEYEGVYPAMDSLSHYIKRYGLPRSIYLDKFKTYKASRKPTLYEELRGEGALSQYQRALKELGAAETIVADLTEPEQRRET
ncbi:MAG: ISNCY family transposase, partial [Acidobacteriota bacterium]